MGRQVPGDLGWRLDDEDEPPREAGGLLRVLSVIPFVVLGAVAVIALVGWLLLFVFGVGEQESLWTWVSDEDGWELLRGLALVLGLGAACLAVLVLAMWAALYGFRREARGGFWRVSQALAAGALLALLVVEAMPEARASTGLRWFDVVFLVGSLVASIVLFRLRERRTRPVTRDAGEGAG